MALSGRSDKLREKIKVRQRQLVELEVEAGIADAAERLRSEPPSYHLVYDAVESGSDEMGEMAHDLESSHQKSIDRKLRKLYFSVGDVRLRRDLIEADREVGNCVQEFWRQELEEAYERQKAAQSTNSFWWVWASICGAILIGLGFHFFGLVGALAGLLAGYLWSRQMERNAMKARQEAIADAECRFRDAEQTWKEARNEKRKFSSQEAKTGEPDRRG